MKPHDCPGKAELEAFALGKIGDEAAEPIAEHLDRCPRCAETIDLFSEATDPILARLRRPAEPGRYETDSQCQQAVARVKQFGHEPSISSVEEMPTAASGQAAAAPVSTITLRQLRDYQLLEKLGQGGMGAVYKARHVRLDKIVALKVLPAERMQDAGAVARFQREMRAVGHLDHPHIVRAMDAGEAEGTHYLVMEYVEGVDLSHLAKQHGPLPIAEACELIRQAALGLQEAHESSMVHRDIKPSNLMLCAAGKRRAPIVKVLDLGLALLADAHATGTSELTTTGQMMGTLDYMAPEQGGDSKKVDIRADIYALGATLYRLLTGRVIYPGERYQTPVQKLMALAMEPAPPIQPLRKEISAELAAIVHRMLEKSPQQRYATPQEVADALTPFAAGADLAALLAGSAAATQASHDPPAGTESHVRSGDMATDQGSPNAPREQFRSAQAARAIKPPGRLVALLAVGGLAALLAGLVLYWQTRHGTVRVEILDDQIEARFDQNGLVLTGADKEPIRITPTAEGKLARGDKSLASGEHTLTIIRGAFSFQTTNFRLEAKGETVVRIRLLEGEVKVSVNDKPIGLTPLGPTVKSGQSLDLPPPPVQYALEFDGSWVEIPTLSWDGSPSLTLEARVESPPGNPFLMTVASMGGTGVAQLNRGGDGPQWFGYAGYDPQGQGHFVYGASPARSDSPVHLALVIDASRVRLFENGKLADEQPSLEKFTGAKSTGTGLGAQYDVQEKRWAVGFKGRIYNVRISSTPRYVKDFTPDDRFKPDDNTLALYQFDEGQGNVLKDSSGNNHHGKIVGAKWVRADLKPEMRDRGSAAPVKPKPAGYALHFTDESQEPDFSAVRLPTRGPWTVEGWITPQQPLPSGNEASLVFMVDPCWLSVRGSSQGIKWALGGPTSAPPPTLYSTAKVVIGEAVHVAITREAGGVCFFVNGEKQGEPLPIVFFTPESRLRVCLPGNPSRRDVPFQGEVDEVRVSSIVRYRDDFSPDRRFEPDGDTVALFHFDEGEGDLLMDSSHSGRHGKILGSKWVKVE
jgi:serine/threonine protein kinase